MMIYQKLFSEYNQLAAQILMTKRTVMDNLSRFNALNTFRELLKLGAIPIVNENDTVSTYEMQICCSCCRILTVCLRMIRTAIQMRN